MASIERTLEIRELVFAIRIPTNAIVEISVTMRESSTVIIDNCINLAVKGGYPDICW